MSASKQAKSVFLLAAAAAAAAAAASSSSASAAEDIVWSTSGGGWRSMVAQSAYAQVFSNLGILDTKEASSDNDIDRPRIRVMAGTSGSDWFIAQFAFSENYYKAVVDGSPASLAQFTQDWMDAYATTQANIPPTCGILQELCDMGASSGPLSEVAALFPLSKFYNWSWPNIVYAMFNATSNSVYDDSEFVSVKASSQTKLSTLDGVDICFHTSLLPNARAYDANTITYLAQDYTNISSSYTVPLPYDYCVGDTTTTWLPESFPGGNVYNLNRNESFANSNVVKGFPMYPPKASDGLFVTPQRDKDTNETDVVSLSPQDMSLPFGDDPTALQLSVAASSAMGCISEGVASFFAQGFSTIDSSIQQSDSLTVKQKVEFKIVVSKLQDTLWTNGLLANVATMSGWVDPNPSNMPPADASNYWFTDGGYTDGPSAAQAIARYQQLYGITNPIKLIISNQNYWSNNNNNILDYFNYNGNEGGQVQPGEFIWPMGVGAGSQTNPQMSKQIFGEEMTAEMLDELMEPVNGTNLTMAILPVATTVDNGERISLLSFLLMCSLDSFTFYLYK